MKKNISIQKVLCGLAAIIFLVACDKDETSVPEDLIYYQTFSINKPDYINNVISYDVDGDLIDDLEITTTFEEYPIALNLGMDYTVQLNCINESMEFCNFKEGTESSVIKLDDDINSKDIFRWMKVYTYQGNVDPTSKDSFSPIYYYGFKMAEGYKTYYGWFRLQTFEVQGIAISEIANRPILVGQKE